jgi:dTDP-4-dehydrorhamnose 3,5-epimerase
VRFEPTPLDGAWLIELERHEDERGWFARTFCADEFAEHGLPTSFPQSNLAHNARAGTLRGMHFNAPALAESKVVRCTRGAMHAVIVDLRTGSRCCRDWFGIGLSDDDGRALFVPEGFATGYLTLVDDTEVGYQMGRSYAPDAARGFRWDDPAVGIRWPRRPVVISTRDATYPDLDDAVAGA